MFLEGIFADVEFETVVEFLEEAASHEVSFVDDDGILCGEFAEVGKCRAEHGVSAHIAHAALLVELFESRLDRTDVGEDACGREIWYDLFKDAESVFETDCIDDKFGRKLLNLFECGEAHGVVHEAEALGVNVVDGYFVVEGEQIGKE